jgi:hypothetical protein
MLPEGQPTAEKHTLFSAGGKKEGYQTQRKQLQHAIDIMPSPSENFLGGMVYVWDEVSHPFIGGGYSSPRAGSFDLGLQGAMSHFQTVDDKGNTSHPGLFFAGEGTSSGPGATAHSAIDTGTRAALQVSEFLRGE